MGDSITLGLNKKENRDLLPQNSVVKAMNGATTNFMLMYDEYIWKPKQLKRVILMFGVNEISATSYNENFLVNYEAELKYIQKFRPDVEVYVMSILPVRSKKINNILVSEANQRLQQLVESQHNSKIKFINCHDAFVSPDGKMNMALSTDGIHLNRKGYEVLATFIQ